MFKFSKPKHRAHVNLASRSTSSVGFKEENTGESTIREEEIDEDHDKYLSFFANVYRGEDVIIRGKKFSGNNPFKDAIRELTRNFDCVSYANYSYITGDDLWYLKPTLVDLLADCSPPNLEKEKEKEKEKDKDKDKDKEKEKEKEKEKDKEKEDDDEDKDFSRIQRRIKEEQRGVQAKKFYAKPLLEGFQKVLDWVNAENILRVREIEELKRNQIMRFDGLAEVFKPGEYLLGHSVDTGASPIGFRVLSRFYDCTREGKNRATMHYFTMTVEFVISTGKSFIAVPTTISIPEFAGNRPFISLDYMPMSEDAKSHLSKRGRNYQKYSIGSHYMAYATDCFTVHTVTHLQGVTEGAKSPNLSAFLRTSGRVMLDGEIGRKMGCLPARRGIFARMIDSFLNGYWQQVQAAKHNEQYNPSMGRLNSTKQTTYEEFDLVPEDMLCLTWPAIVGFSFSAKVWGYTLVDGISDIKFDDKAFDQLVMDKERKRLIRAMVKHSENIFKDIISGKGGGSIFLLHGPPGTGKTLTAEAIAEILHRPLYAVSMAEMGTTPQELESKLTQVFELASLWDALVLMDEADIFLERRGQKEIVRNAMVGVLMRQIEYFQGVLFLTSNRVDVFDEAFHSRVTVALKYAEHTKDTRSSVWNVLLTHSGITGINFDDLSQSVLNGRQIKNCICLAQGLAADEGVPVNENHLKYTIDIVLEFKKEMVSIGAGVY